ncbi:MAG: putative toxin-antitoxin system toxin component, PIN family [Phycisphaerae bacterium]|nr:putative toxin-antitoxin system toxin component, PIN family [Saprospiraceae bacterium]
MPEYFVLDTNTVISGIIWTDSIPAKAIAKARAEGVILISKETEAEFRDTMGREKFDKLKPIHLRLADLEILLSVCRHIEVLTPVQACRDPKDNKFLALAKDGKATLIVSGDKDLLDMNQWEGIPILTARQFLEMDI